MTWLSFGIGFLLGAITIFILYSAIVAGSQYDRGNQLPHLTSIAPFEDDDV